MYRKTIFRLLVCVGISVIFAASSFATDREKPFTTLAGIESALNLDSTLEGQVVYIDFWASWCAPCRTSFPWMHTLNNNYRDQGLRIITINLDKDHAAAQKFLADLGDGLEVVYDSTGTLAKMFEIEAMPTSFLYDRSGNLHGRHQGFKAEDSEAMTATISTLLQKGEKK